MKFLFIQQDVFRNRGVMLISANLKKNGHECDVLISSLEKDLINKVKLTNPDIIGFSIDSTRYDWMKNVAKTIKSELNKTILVGGPHPTFFPELINEDFVDVICVGEGEKAIIELANKLDIGENITNIDNIWVKKDGKIYKNPIRHLIEDLDSLPFEDRTLYDKYDLLRNHNVAAIMTSRGCPYKCTFCFNKKYNELYKGKGRILRRRSVSNVINEIKTIIRNNKKINYLVFEDDTFILGSKDWFDDLFQRYKKEIGINFSVTARADLVNEEIIKKLKDAGCHSIRMGVESANTFLREKVLKKNITNEQIINSAKIIKKYRINLQLFNILGTPGETIDTALETYELSYKINPTYAWCSLMQPYPGTEIMDVAKEKNLISENFTFDNLDNSYFSTIPLDIARKKEIVNLQKLFQLGNMLRIPKNVMKHIIKLPQNEIFNLIFKGNYALGMKRLDNLKWGFVFKVALYNRDYLEKKKSSKEPN